MLIVAGCVDQSIKIIIYFIAKDLQIKKDNISNEVFVTKLKNENSNSDIRKKYKNFMFEKISKYI